MLQENRKKRAAKAAARAAGYLLTAMTAIFLAVVLSVLFAAVRSSGDIGETGVEKGDILVVWKPAYLFSVPEEGDLVMLETEENSAGEEPFRVEVYDKSRTDMSRIRGKAVWRIPFPGERPEKGE